MAQGRVVCHIDLDCFYVQVERQKDPALVDVPCAVVQYNKWQGTGTWRPEPSLFPSLCLGCGAMQVECLVECPG